MTLTLLACADVIGLIARAKVGIAFDYWRLDFPFWDPADVEAGMNAP